MSKPPYSRRLAAVLAITSMATCAACAPADAHAPVAHASKSGPAKHLSKRARANLRRQLARELKRNPMLAFSKQFMKKADLVDFTLPLTVRLDKSDGQGGYLPSDDQLEIDYDDSVVPWPIAGQTMPASQTPHLGGTFTMEANFGSDTTGYGQLGNLETVDGGAVNMTSEPFDVSDFDPACASGPAITGDPANKVVITSTGPRYGVLNPFSGAFQGSLSLRMTFASQVQDTCGGTTSLTPTVDNTTAPPMPIRLDGKFYVSPALTADGKMRFGKIVIDDSVTPQISTFAYVRACTNTLTCDAQEFPARVKIKYLTADVLLGDIRSS